MAMVGSLEAKLVSITQRPDLLEKLGLAAIALCYLYHAHGYSSAIGPAVIDDAFITLRYARHFAAGHGLVYNIGEPVEGYTSFLWTLILAAVTRLGLDPLRTAQLFGVLAGLVTLWATWRLAGLLLAAGSSWLHLVPPLFLATNRTFCVWSIEAMETKLFGMLFGLALLAWLRLGTRSVRRVPITGTCLALLCLTRPEGYLFALGLAVLATIRARSSGEWPALGRQISVFVILTGAHLVFRLVYYGDLVPNTFYIKVGGLDVAGGLRYLQTAGAANFIALYLVLVLLGAASLLWRQKQRGDALYGIVIVGLYLLYLLGIGGDYFEFRFLDVILPVWAVFAAQGIGALQERLGAVTWRRHAVGAGLAVWVIGANGASIMYPYVGTSVITSPERERRFTQTFARAGRWLGRNLNPEESIAIRPAGVIAYLFCGSVLDTLGLNDRAIAREPRFRIPGPSGHQRRVPVSYLRERGITYFIGHPRFLHEPGPRDEVVSVEVSPGEYLIFRSLRPDAELQPGVYGLGDHAGSLEPWQPLERCHYPL